MAHAAYAGNENLTFSDYIDMETGRTLSAEPGRLYDIMPASGRNVGDIPAPWFVAVDDDAWAEAQATAEAVRQAMADAAAVDRELAAQAAGEEPGSEEG